MLKALDSGNQRSAVVGLLMEGHVFGGLAASGAKSLVLLVVMGEVIRRPGQARPGLGLVVRKLPARSTSFFGSKPRLGPRAADAPGAEQQDRTAPDGSQKIVALEGINLGFAAQTDRGLMVPSIRAAEKLSAPELNAQIRRLAVDNRGCLNSPAIERT